MSSISEVTVSYKWTAQPGKFEELVGIYEEVAKQMEETEVGTLKLQIAQDKEKGELYVVDVFKDAEALGFHLTQTAAKHIQSLLAIAAPGTFAFIGDLPDEMVQAIQGMGLPAVFTTGSFGFSR